jgi:hypothetical protein
MGRQYGWHSRRIRKRQPNPLLNHPRRYPMGQRLVLRTKDQELRTRGR